MEDQIGNRAPGPGPADPLAGLSPPTSSAEYGELGLWLTHQLDIDVDLIYDDDGFTVRLRGGAITRLQAPKRHASTGATPS